MSRQRPPIDAEELPATERSNPSTQALDRLDAAALVDCILSEDAGVAAAVRAAAEPIALACERLAQTLRAGGRWFNVGAGTSGRIGALDAAEIPPTFGLAPERVQALIAGGERALLQAVEGAEDDAAAGANDLRARDFGADDALVAISASGHTPYALGACRFARDLGALTVAITCAGDSPLAAAAEISIACEVGPEVITGSTRMKGGLAQKMVLHTLSTAAMVRLGRVRGNRMTGIRAINAKLERRALRILAELAACTPDEARAMLDASGGDVEAALRAFGVAGSGDGPDAKPEKERE